MRWSKFRCFKDRKVDLTIKDNTFKGRILKFAGLNEFKQKVIITSGQGIHFVDSWRDVKIVDFVDERIFKD
jgi:hypothetical protein